MAFNSFQIGLLGDDAMLLHAPRVVRIGKFLGVVIASFAALIILGCASWGIWWPAIGYASYVAITQMAQSWIRTRPHMSNDEMHETHRQLYNTDPPCETDRLVLMCPFCKSTKVELSSHKGFDQIACRDCGATEARRTSEDSEG